MVTETTHVIFDLDGTLVNSIDVLIDVLIEYAAKHGKDFSLDIRKKVANLSNFTIFFNEFFDSLALNEELNREELMLQLLESSYSRKFQLIPGVERLVKHLHRHNIPMAIATGNYKRYYTLTRQKFPEFFDKFFAHAICGMDDPDVVNKKPHPDVYFICADRFQQKPKDYKNVLIVEDSMTGITGAIASGMKTLLINDQTLCDFSGVAHKISLICDNFGDFKPETLGLPPFTQ